jgi:hypothetical protein
MDINFDGLSRILPLGGTTILFMLLLGWLMNERASWVSERKAREVAHAEELDRQRSQCQIDIDRVRTDYERNLESNRTRIDELENENRDLRSRLRERA